MKKIILFSLIFTFIITISFSLDEDTSVIDKLGNTKTKETEFDFSLKKFESCEDFKDVMEGYIKSYYKNNKHRYYYGQTLLRTQDSVEEIQSDSSSESSNSLESNKNLGEEDFSKTNIQVKGVDESDIVKTDGKHIYYYNEKEKSVYISEINPLKIIKKIRLPKNFYEPVLYLGDNRLIILASAYSHNDYSRKGYWINRSNKTYSIIFDVGNPEKAKLLKLYISDGQLKKSRKIGKYIYVLSDNYFNVPYHSFESENDIIFKFDKILPKKIDISKTSNKNKKNLKIKGKNLPFNVNTSNIAKCNEIEYILPNTDTIKKYDFNPSYNIISIIDIENTEKQVKTKVIAGNNSNVYMSLENLYLTDNLYQERGFSCPPNRVCILGFYPPKENTIIHKLEINEDNLNYKNSTIIPGKPLNQYSMDEKDGDFRIVTSQFYPERQTDIYILDKDLKLVSSLKGLGKEEVFQSSRFIGDKLFLVTFKQIDPLFAIDLSDRKNPKILGELKIPGYSTYLHPYDDNHLIGLGYDTIQNRGGGTINNGVKIDLYEINYNKKCSDLFLSLEEKKKCSKGDYKGIIVKRKYSLTLGEYGSYSEVLDNPRVFVWNKDKNLFLLPAEIYENYENDIYRHKTFFQGFFALDINKDTGIKQKYKVTHIDESGLGKKRQEECSKYSPLKKETECRKLINGGLYCPPKNNIYVPEYCYAESSINEYLASKSGEYRGSFIKRVLWVGDKSYHISDKKIGISELETGVLKEEEVFNP